MPDAKDLPYVQVAAEQMARAEALEAEVERLGEIERVFNEGWLPPLPGEGPSLRLKALHRLRELIPDA